MRPPFAVRADRRLTCRAGTDRFFAPMRTHLRSPRFRRALTACLALAATLIAASAPLVHVAVHTGYDAEHAATFPAGVELHDASDHDHGDVHHPSLHDQTVVQRAQLESPAPALPEAVAVILAAEPEQVVGTRPIHRLPSRAPPPGDRARAPPLA